MIIQVMGRLWGEDGILLVEDATSKLLLADDTLPKDVALKVYLAVVKQKRTSGTIKSSADKMTYAWKVLPSQQPFRQRPRRGWRAAAPV
ncbi:MAG TPA: hypothetical protein VNK04_24545 [Gemmataceae bacterium]|nr:hypothetical protein [Gemmataceae bacterium]